MVLRTMPHSDQERHLAIAANGDDVQAQIDRLEHELRHVHMHLDGVLCALESLMRNPTMTPQLMATIRLALEPAADAIQSGSSRLRDQMCPVRTGTGW